MSDINIINLAFPECRIVNIEGRYEVYNNLGDFIVSGDTEPGEIDGFKVAIVDWLKQNQLVSA